MVTGFHFGTKATCRRYAAMAGDTIQELEDLGKSMSDEERADAWASLQMIRQAISELFGPAASIETEEAVLLRGREFHYEAEAIVEALTLLALQRDWPRAKPTTSAGLLKSPKAKGSRNASLGPRRSPTTLRPDSE